MEKDDVTKIRELVEDLKFAMITAPVREEDLDFLRAERRCRRSTTKNRLWFFIASDSELATQVAQDPRFNAAFASKETWASVAGRAAVVQDAERIDHYWTASSSCGLMVTTPGSRRCGSTRRRPRYPGHPGGKVTTVLSLVKSVATGEPMTGDHGTMGLSPSASVRISRKTRCFGHLIPAARSPRLHPGYAKTECA